MTYAKPTHIDSPAVGYLHEARHLDTSGVNVTDRRMSGHINDAWLEDADESGLFCFRCGSCERSGLRCERCNFEQED